MAMGIITIWYISSKIPLKARIQLLRALVISQLQYACVLYNAISQENKTKLERQLNWGVRVCYGISRSANCDELKLKNGILNTAYQRDYFTLIKFATLYAKTSAPFSILKFPNFIIKENTRTGTITKIKFSKSVFQQSFINNAIHVWNTLPAEIKSKAEQLRNFKKIIKKYLIVQQCSSLRWNLQNTWRNHGVTNVN